MLRLQSWVWAYRLNARTLGLGLSGATGCSRFSVLPSWLGICSALATLDMIPHSRALVVAPTPEIAQSLVYWLTARGHEVVLLNDFAAARRELDARPPSLLVTELKLGAFNGLHLTLRARARFPGVSAIVIGEADCVLQAEARQQHIRYLVRPFDESTFAGIVREMYGWSLRPKMLSETLH